MAFGLTYHQLKALDPCEDGLKTARKALGGARKWNGNLVTAGAARDAGVSLDDILWATKKIARSDKQVARRLRHFSADCAARVLHLFEDERPNDERPRKAIEVSRAFADGQAGDAAWDAAGDAAGDAARAAAGDAAGDAAWGAARAAAGDAAWAAAWDAARAAAGDAAWDAARAAAGAAAGAAARGAARAGAWDAARAAAWDAAWGAARAAAGDAAWAAARAAAWDAEKAWQFDRLIEWLSDEEPEPLELPKKVEAGQ